MINIEYYTNSDDYKINKFREDCLEAINSALIAIDPYNCIIKKIKKENGNLIIGEKKFKIDEYKNIYLISVGKASVKMAKGILSFIKPNKTIIVSNQEKESFFNKKDEENIEYIKASHPLPDLNSTMAGKKILELSEKTNKEDLTIFLISGGASSLVEYPIIDLELYRILIQTLMKKGADINELNIIRKHLSIIKGGKILKKINGTVLSLILSDVVGDSMETIASGLTYYDSSTFSDALKILKKYRLVEEYKNIYNIFIKGIKGEIEETLKLNDSLKCNFTNILVGSNKLACIEAIKYLKDKGYSTFYLSSEVEGNVEKIARMLIKKIKTLIRFNKKEKRPIAVIFGGETTVNVKGSGLGGRNSEFVLRFINNINRKSFFNKRWVFASIATDGVDGNSPAMGAISDSQKIIKKNKKGKPENIKSNAIKYRDIDKYLENNDSYSFFSNIKDAIITGPTGTNVADIGIVIIE